jgi:hypothetical protein
LQNTITSTKAEILSAISELREFVRVLNDDQAAAISELREFVRVLNDDQAAALDLKFSGFPDVVGLSVLASINDANDRVIAEVAESRELIIKTLPLGE